DHWWVSCQQQSGVCNLTGDPVLTFAISQTGAPVQPSGYTGPASGNHLAYFHYSVTVPAGATEALMVFVQMSDTQADAQADALAFNTNSSLQTSGYLAGLSPPRLAEIVNWNVS